MTSPERTVGVSVRRRYRQGVLRWLGPVILLVASVLVGLVHVPQHTTLSIADEYVYVDYLAKVPTEFVVHQGEETGTFARKALACRGLWNSPPYPAALCSTSAVRDDAAFPLEGKTSADIYTPLYFAVTWAVAQPIQWLGVSDLVNAGRLVGSLWLAAGALILFLGLRRAAIPRPTATALGLLMVGSMSAFWANTYVTTDATALVAGAGTVLFLATIGSVRRFSWPFLAFGVVMTLFKLQNFGAIAVACVFLVIRAIIDARTDSRRSRIGAVLMDPRTITAVLTTLLSVAGQAGWLAIRAATAESATAYEDTTFSLRPQQLIYTLFTYPLTTGSGAATPAQMGNVASSSMTALMILTVAGAFGLLVARRISSVDGSIAASTVTILLLLGPALTVVFLVTTGFTIALPNRYGTALLPLCLLCLGLLIDPARKSVSRVLLGLSVVMFAASLVVNIH